MLTYNLVLVCDAANELLIVEVADMYLLIIAFKVHLGTSEMSNLPLHYILYVFLFDRCF